MGAPGGEEKRLCLETPSAGFGAKPSAVSLLLSSLLHAGRLCDPEHG